MSRTKFRRNNKFFRIISDKSGVTLMELIISMVILSIFMAAAVGLLVPILNTYVATKEHTNASVLANNISETIGNDLNFAVPSSVKFSEAEHSIIFTKHTGEKVKWASVDGALRLNDGIYYAQKTGDAVLKRGYYFGNEVELGSFSVTGNICNYTITVSGKGNIEKKVSVKLMEK